MVSNKHKKTIWLVLDSGKVGGIETHVVLLSKYLLENNYNTSVIFLNDYSKCPVPQQLAANGINVRFLDGRMRTLLKIIRHEKPDIIHAHGYKPGVLCKIFGKAVGVPVVCTHHPGSRGKGRIYFYNWLDESLSFLANTSIAVNDKVSKRLLTKNLKVIPNFVFLPEKNNVYRDKMNNCIGFIGRFHPEKGPDLFCHLASHLPSELKLSMYGDGELQNDLQKQYSERIQFHGNTDQVALCLQTMDLLCLTSRSEGLPLIALEAMALGVPVTAFSVGGMPDLIDSGKNGFLVKPGSITDFSETIQAYYQLSQKQRLSIQQAAYETVDNRFSERVLGPKIEAVYHRITQ